VWAAAGSVDLIGSPLAGMGATPATIRRPPPLIGEHTAEILGELGYDAARIAGLQEQAII
jgi:crotonobetainyl-CoA:carnitine CoA-transferase CaiB-like acyl-CoA transferase